MKISEEKKFVIRQIREKGLFEPEDNSYNSVLKELKRDGWLNIIDSETSDIPILVRPSKEFSKKYKEHFE